MPQSLVSELRRCPGQDTLAALGASLDYASPAWLALFSRMGGLGLLVQVGDTC